MFELTASSGTNLGLYPGRQEAKTQANAFYALGRDRVAMVLPAPAECFRDDLPSRALICS